MSPFTEMNLGFQGNVTLVTWNRQQNVTNGNCRKVSTVDRNNSFCQYCFSSNVKINTENWPSIYMGLIFDKSATEMQWNV